MQMIHVPLLENEFVVRQASEIRFYLYGEIYEAGLLSLTNYRLLWIAGNDLKEIALKDIFKIDSTAGFLNVSSPKIILDILKLEQNTIKVLKDWECHICNTINMGNSLKCVECGVLNQKERFKNDGITCSKCTFTNMVGKTCEMCGNSLLDENVQIKLSFRQGGITDFLSDLKKYWNKKEWERYKSDSPTLGLGGVSTVLDRLNESKIKDEQVLSTAFTDLKALINSAKEMVELASTISSKVVALNSADSDTKEIIEFRNSLLNLGINDPVTRQGTKNDYFLKLSNQIQDFLDVYFKTHHPKIISTIDLYCLFNRARGLDMVSPQDLIRACESFSVDSKYRLRCFEGGGKFVQSKSLTDNDFSAQVLKLLSDHQYLTASVLAIKENISIILAKEELLVLYYYE